MLSRAWVGRQVWISYRDVFHSGAIPSLFLLGMFKQMGVIGVMERLESRYGNPRVLSGLWSRERRALEWCQDEVQWSWGQGRPAPSAVPKPVWAGCHEHGDSLFSGGNALVIRDRR